MVTSDTTPSRAQFMAMLMTPYGIFPDEEPPDNLDDYGYDYHIIYCHCKVGYNLSAAP